MRLWPYRCVDCRKRRTLLHSERMYSVTPRCLNTMCGEWKTVLVKKRGTIIKRRKVRVSGGFLQLDKHRKHKEHKRVECTCDAYHYPHRKSSGRCWYRVDGSFKSVEEFDDSPPVDP